MESAARSIEESLELADKWDGAAGGRIRYAFTPRFALSCSDSLLREVGRIARERGAIIHTHCAENRDEVQLVIESTGVRNAVYLHQVGLLGPTTVLAHCIHIDEEEMALLADTGTHVAHCPATNLKLASGIAPVPEMLERGINVGLGSDGAGANNNLDPFIDMRFAALIHKPRLGPTAMPAAKVLEMATMGGARAMGQAHLIGSIEEGKLADIVLLDLNKPHAWPSAGVDPVSRIVYSAKSSDVVMTMVGGKVLYEGGRDGRGLTHIDEEEVLANCRCNTPRRAPSRADRVRARGRGGARRWGRGGAGRGERRRRSGAPGPASGAHAGLRRLLDRHLVDPVDLAHVPI